MGELTAKQGFTRMREIRGFLYIVVFMAGAAIMSIELAASRMLAPFFGYSIYVWGSLLGVIMAALAVGYLIGGWSADKCDDVRALYRIVLGVAVYVGLMPWFGWRVIASVQGLGVMSGSVLSTFLIFFVPMSLLAMASPMVIKFETRRLSGVGLSAGTVYAVSTVGSIFGTFLTAFILIPSIGTKTTILGIALVLGVLALTGLAGGGGKINRVNHLLIGIILLGFLAPSWTASGLVYSKESEYNVIRVFDFPNHRELRFHNEYYAQTVMNKHRLLTGTYLDYFSVAPAFNDGRTVLFIGLAGGTAVKQLAHYHDLKIDAIEIDGAVVDVARQYFDLQEDENLGVHVADGRRFLKESGAYDIICIDAYSGTSIPSHLATSEFFKEVSEHLTGDGVVVMNVFSASNREEVAGIMAETVSTAFPSIFIVDAPRNSMIMAFKDETSPEEFRKALASVEGELEEVAKKAIKKHRKYTPIGGKFFTDDWCPIEEYSL